MTYFYELIHSQAGLPVKAVIHSVSEIEMHWHKQVEFLMVLEGSVNIRIGSSKFTLETGDFIFINSQVIHNTLQTGEQNLLLAVQINPDFYASIYPNINEFYFECNSFSRDSDIRDRQTAIRKYLAQIVWDLSRQQPGYRSRIGSSLFLLAGELISFPFYKKEDIKDETTDEDLQRLQRIIQYIDQNLHRKLTLKELGAMEHISYYYLSHFIQDKLGISFQEYLKHARLQKAVELLLSSDKSIAEVANEVGFTSATAFIKSFKKEFRVSPGEYRELINCRNILFQPDKSQLTVKKNTGPDDVFHTPASSPPVKSRSYLDVDRQAALTTLFSYLDTGAAEQSEPGYAEPVSGGEQLHITVATDQAGQPWRPYWKKLASFTRAAEGLRGQWQQQLQEMQEEIGFEHIRFHGIFSDDMMIYQTDLRGNVSYNWTYVDTLFDSLLKAGIKPFVELGFMPAALSRSEETVFWWKANISPPQDILKWKGLVDAFVRHCINRYGQEEVESWYFEVWNEPELTNVFWAGEKEEYFDFYKETVLTVKRASPRIKVGGPAITGQAATDSPWLEDFLDYCRREQVPVDFVSLHIYPERFPEEANESALQLDSSLLFEERTQMLADIPRIYNGPDHICQTLQLARAKIEKIWGCLPEICITEWNASAYNRNLIHDTVYAAAFIIHNIVQCIGLADMMAYWTFTDINEEVPLGVSPFHGSFGLINKDGIKKASYFAYYFLSKLGDQILAKGEGYIITKSQAGIQILLYNFAYFDPLFMTGDTSALTESDRYRVFEDKPEQEVTMLLSGIEGRHQVNHYRLNRKHGSAFDKWIEMGAPQDMSAEEIKYLKNHSYPEMQVKDVMLAGEHKETITLPVHGVELILLKRIV